MTVRILTQRWKLAAGKDAIQILQFGLSGRRVQSVSTPSSGNVADNPEAVTILGYEKGPGNRIPAFETLSRTSSAKSSRLRFSGQLGH